MNQDAAFVLAVLALAVGLFGGYSVGWCVGWWRRGKAIELGFWGTESGRKRREAEIRRRP